jgi:cytidyltransferase-like protein
MGDVVNHEGVVLRDEKMFGSNPVKITGDFILGGMQSSFQDDTSLSENEEDFIGYPFEPVEEQEDESADPVVDADFTGETVAFVPGAFKPPHLGHLKMVEQYANRNDVDRVIILISSPKKKNRTLEDGTVIKATHAEDVWKLLLTSAGLSANPKIDLRVSSEPSPIGATLDMIGPNGILKPGDRVILGASDKPDDSGVPDWHRWLFVEPKDMMQGVELLDRQENAVKAFDRQGGIPFRARDMRSLISKARTDVNAIEELEEFVGEDNVFELLAIFGMGPRQEEVDAELEERAMATNVGSMGYGAPPISSQSKIKKFNKKEKEISKLKRENVDLNMVDEVMKLIIDKGILR